MPRDVTLQDNEATRNSKKASGCARRSSFQGRQKTAPHSDACAKAGRARSVRLRPTSPTGSPGKEFLRKGCNPRCEETFVLVSVVRVKSRPHAGRASSC